MADSRRRSATPSSHRPIQTSESTQDERKVGSRATVNAGLRTICSSDTIETDRNNVSPRLGGFSGRLAPAAIRASAGRYYDRIPLRAVANALLSAGNTTDVTELRQISVVLSPAQTGAPAFPNILAAVVPTTTLVSFTTIDPHIQDAYSDQGSVEVEQQLGPSSTISLGYDHLRGRHLIMQINRNVPACVAVGNNNGCRPNPNYATTIVPSSAAGVTGCTSRSSSGPLGWVHIALPYANR
jgi:hypothetical protein